VEVVRSFSFKLNLGNYQSADFFCSQKTECSVETAEDASIALYKFCKTQVLASVNEFEAEHASAQAARQKANEQASYDQRNRRAG